MVRKYVCAAFITAVLGFANAVWGVDRSAVEKGNSTVSFTVIKDLNGVIEIPVSDFASGKAGYYIYRLPESSVRFLVLKSSDGVIRASLDACNVCFSKKRGFHQEGDQTVCNTCGRRYPSTVINDITGGCYPVPLTRSVKAGKVVLSAQELKSLARYFL